MKKQRLEELLNVANSDGIAAALEMATKTGDIDQEPMNVSVGMQSRIDDRLKKRPYTFNVIKGIK